jgi:predicted NAD-dependent protein-ADP-ribosyltransferase YbiA (DUF1768 family)
MIYPLDVVHFGSATRKRWLSNFAAIDGGMRLDGHVWPSSEHCFQAWLRVHPSDWHRLALGGDLCNLDSLKLFYTPEVAAKKIKYWAFKNQPACVGIVAKMAVNPKWNNKLATPLRLVTREVSPTQMNACWRLILTTKLEACPQFRKELKATGDKILIEFDGKAKYKSDMGNAPFWCGLYKDGVIYGRNQMGKYLMEVRAVM